MGVQVSLAEEYPPAGDLAQKALTAYCANDMAKAEELIEEAKKLDPNDESVVMVLNYMKNHSPGAATSEPATSEPATSEPATSEGLPTPEELAPCPNCEPPNQPATPYRVPTPEELMPCPNCEPPNQELLFPVSEGTRDTVVELNNKGTELFLSGRYIEALDLTNQALVLGPVDPVIMWNKAVYLELLGRDAEALDAYTRVSVIDPSYNPAGVSVSIGVILEGLGRDAEALDAYKRAADIDPDGYGRDPYWQGKISELERKIGVEPVPPTPVPPTPVPPTPVPPTPNGDCCTRLFNLENVDGCSYEVLNRCAGY